MSPEHESGVGESGAGPDESCAACGAPLVEDQRYCLECGERRFPMSSVLLGGMGGPQSGGSSRSQSAASPPAAPPGYGSSSADGGGRRGNAVTVIAGVGVLLLAMGVGVLIGRSGASSKQPVTPTQVISVSQPAPATGASATETTPANTEPASKSGSSKSSKGGSAKETPAASGAASAKGANESHPAPPSVVQNLAKKHGKSYEQESKNLPNVVSTGG